MQNWKIWLGVVLAVLAMAAVACGGDNDSSDTDDDSPQATEAPADDGEEPADNGDADPPDLGGEGSATLTVGEQTWTFEGVFCAFSPEESRNERVSFTLSAFGTSDTGARTQLDATIQDTDEEGRYEGDGVIHSVSLNDIDDFENPSVALNSLNGMVGTAEDIIAVDGKNVSAEMVFEDDTTDAFDNIPGTLEATCP